MSISLSQEIAPLLPYLRRYARALAGSQKSGDAYVRACLQALVADQSIMDTSDGVKIGLYRLFHVLWNATVIPPDGNDGTASIFEQTAQQRLSSMAPENRQTLLLSTSKDFRCPKRLASLTRVNRTSVNSFKARLTILIARPKPMF